MDKQRTDFEAHALDRGLSLARINSIDDIYDNDQTDEAWEAWTASRKLALEEAAGDERERLAQWMLAQAIGLEMLANRTGSVHFDAEIATLRKYAAAIRQQQEEGK